MNFFLDISSINKQGSLCLLRGSLAYILSGVLIWMQYINRLCRKNVSTKFLVYHREIKGLHTIRYLQEPHIRSWSVLFEFLMSLCSKKKRFPSEKTLHQFPLETRKCCYFPGKLGKRIKSITFFGLHDQQNFHHF